jgi:hypothetical protein
MLFIFALTIHLGQLLMFLPKPQEYKYKCSTVLFQYVQLAKCQSGLKRKLLLGYSLLLSNIDDIFQKKLKDKDVAHPDLFVSDYLPNDLSDYNFIFFDSFNKIKLSPDDLEELTKITLQPLIQRVYFFHFSASSSNLRSGNCCRKT